MNKERLLWLPDPLILEPWNTNTYESLYQIFCEDFKNKNRPLFFKDEKIIIFSSNNFLSEGKEKIFWHITDKDDRAYAERLPDIRRAERINWIRPIIENYTDNHVNCFDYLEANGKIKTYLWLEGYDFVVILGRLERANYTLITAFYIGYEQKRSELKKKSLTKKAPG
jgi:hypothetical protein